MRLSTSSQADDGYPGWVPRQRSKWVDDQDVRKPYLIPKEAKGTVSATDREATLNLELDASSVRDPLAATHSPGPQTPPQFADADVAIPPINLPPSEGSGNPGCSIAHNPCRGPAIGFGTWISDGHYHCGNHRAFRILTCTWLCHEFHARHAYVAGIPSACQYTTWTWSRHLSPGQSATGGEKGASNSIH